MLEPNLTPPAFDVDRVRSEFPGLSNGFVFLDNAGGSLTLSRVADRVHDYLLKSDVQLGASYEVSQLASRRVAQGRAELVDLVGAEGPEEVAFGASTTLLLKLLANAIAGRLTPRDEVIVTHADHEANIGPWLGLERLGVKINVWKVRPETMRLETEDLKSLLSPRTKLLCVTHVSNILGTIEPVKEWAGLVHDVGGQICVDGVAFAPHRRVAVKDWDVDYYVLSLYKVYGPHLAVLYGKRDCLLELDGVNHFFVGKDRLPNKLEPGNPCYELAYGSGGIVSYLEELGRGGFDSAGENASGEVGRREDLDRAFERIARHEEGLSRRLLDFLATKDRVRVIGRVESDRDLRVPTISFVVSGHRSQEIVNQVDPHRIGIRFGDFYARRLIEDLGLSEGGGVVRVSMVHYNTVEEIDRLISVLDDVI